MIVASITATLDTKQQAHGLWRFLELPKVGDLIVVPYGEALDYLKVKAIYHHPAQEPQDGGDPSASPSIRISTDFLRTGPRGL